MVARAIVSMLVCISLAPAATMAGDTVASSSSVQPSSEGGESVRECSATTVRALRFIRVAEARLKLDDCDRLQWPLEPPLVLELSYHRAVPAHAFDEAARAMLERNLEEERWRSLQSRVDTFNRGYRDVEDGDVYRLHYDRDGSLRLALNGQTIAREQGHDFARAYLHIWFGEEPYSSRMKASLLNE